MSAPRPNGFMRAKLKEAPKLADLLLKLAALYPKKKNSFNVQVGSTKISGEQMSSVDFTTDPTKITFSVGAVDYELPLASLTYVKRLRCRKYTFKTKVLTDVTP